MADQRLQVEVKLQHGDRTLRELSAKIDRAVIDDTLDLSTGRITLLIKTGTSDFEFDFTPYFTVQTGIAKARYLSIESSQDIEVKLNANTNTAIDIAKPTADPTGQILDPNVARVGYMELKTKNVQKIFISNSSGNEASVTILALASSDNL